MRFRYSNISFISIRLRKIVVTVVLALMPINIMAESNSGPLSSKSTIASSIDINAQLNEVNTLLKQKKYDKAQIIVSALFGEIRQLKKPEIKIDIYTIAGKLSYKQKRYNKAIIQFEKAISLITEDDDQSKKLLAALYHEIAQCYKHLRDIPSLLIIIKDR